MNLGMVLAWDLFQDFRAIDPIDLLIDIIATHTLYRSKEVVVIQVDYAREAMDASEAMIRRCGGNMAALSH